MKEAIDCMKLSMCFFLMLCLSITAEDGDGSESLIPTAFPTNYPSFPAPTSFPTGSPNAPTLPLTDAPTTTDAPTAYVPPCNQRSCYDCLGDPQCGFCGKTSLCAIGTEAGPTDPNQCDSTSWMYGDAAPACMEYCSARTLCSGCTKNDGCGWCANNPSGDPSSEMGRCLPSSDAGFRPVLGDCPWDFGMWFTKSETCVQSKSVCPPAVASLGPSCMNCLSHPGCGWCGVHDIANKTVPAICAVDDGTGSPFYTDCSENYVAPLAPDQKRELACSATCHGRSTSCTACTQSQDGGECNWCAGSTNEQKANNQTCLPVYTLVAAESSSAKCLHPIKQCSEACSILHGTACEICTESADECRFAISVNATGKFPPTYCFSRDAWNESFQGRDDCPIITSRIGNSIWTAIAAAVIFLIFAFIYYKVSTRYSVPGMEPYDSVAAKAANVNEPLLRGLNGQSLKSATGGLGGSTSDLGSEDESKNYSNRSIGGSGSGINWIISDEWTVDQLLQYVAESVGGWPEPTMRATQEALSDFKSVGEIRSRPWKITAKLLDPVVARQIRTTMTTDPKDNCLGDAEIIAVLDHFFKTKMIFTFLFHVPLVLITAVVSALFSMNTLPKQQPYFYDVYTAEIQLQEIISGFSLLLTSIIVGYCCPNLCYLTCTNSRWFGHIQVFATTFQIILSAAVANYQAGTLVTIAQLLDACRTHNTKISVGKGNNFLLLGLFLCILRIIGTILHLHAVERLGFMTVPRSEKTFAPRRVAGLLYRDFNIGGLFGVIPLPARLFKATGLTGLEAFLRKFEPKLLPSYQFAARGVSPLALKHHPKSLIRVWGCRWSFRGMFGLNLLIQLGVIGQTIAVIFNYFQMSQRLCNFVP